MIEMSYPTYSRAERLADGAVHIAGLLAALTGVGALFAMWALRMDGITLASTIVYSGALLIMLGASAAYHLYAHTAARPILRRLDHAAIYVKIAGTFTPLSVLLGTAFGYVILALVWLLAIFGAVTKITAKRGHMPTGWLPYVALGWIGLALFIPLTPILPGYSLALLLAGGLLYTGGVVFYMWESLRFANAIWHLIVVLASACFFLGIVSALTIRL
jgi:hemolysin III